MAPTPDLSHAALVLVDIQEDFCPGANGSKDGSLAVQGGRDIAPVVNRLLHLPFGFKVATQDWHPQKHISFASNHEAPNNQPFTEAVLKNPENSKEEFTTTLWPDHCVQGTKGAEIIPEIDLKKVDYVVKKGSDERVEMYGAFKGVFSDPIVSKSELEDVLRKNDIQKVYLVGIATEVCVMWTGRQAMEAGFETVILSDGCRGINTDVDQVFENLASHSLEIKTSSELLG